MRKLRPTLAFALVVLLAPVARGGSLSVDGRQAIGIRPGDQYTLTWTTNEICSIWAYDATGSNVGSFYVVFSSQGPSGFIGRYVMYCGSDMHLSAAVNIYGMSLDAYIGSADVDPSYTLAWSTIGMPAQTFCWIHVSDGYWWGVDPQLPSSGPSAWPDFYQFHCYNGSVGLNTYGRNVYSPWRRRWVRW